MAEKFGDKGAKNGNFNNQMKLRKRSIMGALELIDIDKALKKLTEQEKGRINASLFTLILWTEKGERDLYFRKTIDAVISKFPARIIFVTKEAQGDYLRTEVASEPIASALFCEKIFVDVGGSYEERVPSIVLAHLLSDLPVYLIWSGVAPLKHPLLPFVKRVIIESETMRDFNQALGKIAELAKGLGEVSDLTWQATRGWRALLSENFREKELMGALKDAERVTLTYFKDGGHEELPVRALYLQAYVAGLASWEMGSVKKKGKGLEILYKSPQGSHEVQLLPDEGSCAPHSLPHGTTLSFELASRKDGVEWVAKRNLEKRQIFFQYSDKKACRLPSFAPLCGAKEGEEIIEELFHPMHPESYRRAVALLAKTEWPV